MKWISVKDKLPEKHPLYKGEWSEHDVLILTEFHYKIGRTKNDKWIDMENKPIKNVTHWMPLPAPPNNTSK